MRDLLFAFVYHVSCIMGPDIRLLHSLILYRHDVIWSLVVEINNCACVRWYSRRRAWGWCVLEGGVLGARARACVWLSSDNNEFSL